MVKTPSQGTIKATLDRKIDSTDDEKEKKLETLAKKNEKVFDEVMGLQKGLSKTDIIKGAESTFKDIRTISWITVSLGVFLIVFPFILAVTGIGNVNLGIEVIGLSGLGIIDLFALYFYKPMDRMQQATTDFTQHTMIYYSWELSTKLWLRWMDWLDGESVRTAIEQIQGSTVMHAELYEKLIKAQLSDTESSGNTDDEDE